MRDPRALISASELAALLGDPSLRIYDCTTKTVPPPPGSDVPYVAVPGLPEFDALLVDAAVVRVRRGSARRRLREVASQGTANRER